MRRTQPSNEKGRWLWVANALMGLSHEVRSQKKILLPAVGTLPSAEVERDVDEWFSAQSNEGDEGLRLNMRPKDSIAPWIAARLAVCSGIAKMISDEPKPRACPEKTSEALKLLCVDEWHATLKDLWMSGERGEFGRS